MQAWWRGASDLDEEQKAIMELPAEGSFSVSGPPGSGKTNLLLMRAAYLSRLRKNVVVLVMNATLARFIRSGAPTYGLSSEVIMTSRQFVTRLAAEAGIVYNSDLSWEEGRAQALQILKTIWEGKQRPMYDAILIDEAQDQSNEELSIIRKLAHDIYLSADSRQLIYSGGSRDDKFENLVDKAKTLRFHYRSGRPVCDFADAIGDSFSSPYERIAPTCRYPSTSPVPEITIFKGPLEEQLEHLTQRLAAQERIYRGELIGVIAPRNHEVAAIADYLRASPLANKLTVQIGANGYMDIDAVRPICLSTIHGAKGLEFRAVHFLAANTISNLGNMQKRLAFTAVTRAKSSLALYHDRDLPGYLASAAAPWEAKREGPSDWGVLFE